MKNKLKPFSVCHSGLIIGELFKAKDVSDLIKNRLPKKVLKNWEIISFINSDNQSICVTREFLDEGMTIKEAIQDWITNGDIFDDVIALNPKRSTLLTVKLSEFSFNPIEA